MIHRIKALYDEGRGSSIRAIAKELELSVNTVRKYLKMDEVAIAAQQSQSSRAKALDAHRDYLVHLLETFPRLSAVKVRRKLEEAVGPVAVSSRSLRRYLGGLREEVTAAQRRYYEPVLDHVPGVQCQVDAGELREVPLGGVATTVYFVVFVLSFSRLMYAGLSRRPIDTETFIRLHDAAFRYFGGCPQECVYDQTKLVVIHEQYRELTLNEHFAQYATVAGFRIRACEGYDPESKGKVEAGVKYVKNDALYGEQATDWPALEQYLAQWLEQVANARLHATTGEVPRDRYEAQERARMRPSLRPALPLAGNAAGELRQADKTGLISFKSNKYSVPLAYQQGQVRVVVTPEGQLAIHDPHTGQCIATHALSADKGVIIKNNDHYRDKSRPLAELEREVAAALGEELGVRLCRQLKQTDPAYYADKLRGLKRHLDRLARLPAEHLARLADREGLELTPLLDYLSAWEAHPERLTETPAAETASPRPEQLGAYAALTRTAAEVRHVH